MGPQAKSEYLAQTRDRYVRAQSRREKGRLLSEAMAVTGYHRKALIRAWRRPERLTVSGVFGGRSGPIIGDSVDQTRLIWPIDQSPGT